MPGALRVPGTHLADFWRWHVIGCVSPRDLVQSRPAARRAQRRWPICKPRAGGRCSRVEPPSPRRRPRRRRVTLHRGAGTSPAGPPDRAEASWARTAGVPRPRVSTVLPNFETITMSLCWRRTPSSESRVGGWGCRGGRGCPTRGRRTTCAAGQRAGSAFASLTCGGDQAALAGRSKDAH